LPVERGDRGEHFDNPRGFGEQKTAQS